MQLLGCWSPAQKMHAVGTLQQHCHDLPHKAFGMAAPSKEHPRWAGIRQFAGNEYK